MRKVIIFEAIATLSTFSMIERNTTAANFSVHPLIHDWARERLKDHERFHYALEAVRHIGSFLDELNLETVDGWKLRKQALLHIQQLTTYGKKILFLDEVDVTRIDCGYFSRIGLELMREGNLDDAFMWLNNALIRSRKQAGDKDFFTIRATSRLASWYTIKSKPNEALTHCEVAHKNAKEAFGEEDTLTLDILDNIAYIYEDTGEIEKSLKLHQEVLEARTRVLGPLHWETLDSLHVVGCRLGRLNRADEALENIQRSLEASEQVNGGDHPQILEIVCSMGRLYLELKDYDESLKHYRRALAGMESIFGKDHYLTLRISLGIGMVYQDQSHFSQALEQFERVLTVRESIWQEDTNAVAEVVEKIAQVQISSSQYKAALASYSRLLKWQEASLGEKHLTTLNTLNQVEYACHCAGLHQEALDHSQKLLAAYQTTAGPTDQKTLDAQSLVGSCFYHLSDYKGAAETYEAYLATNADIENPNHEKINATALDLADVYFDDGRYEAAYTQAERAFEYYISRLPAEYDRVIASLVCLTKCAARMGKSELALSHSKTLLESLTSIKEKNLGDIDPKDTLYQIYAVNLQFIANLLLRTNRDNEASTIFLAIHRYWRLVQSGLPYQLAFCDGCTKQGIQSAHIAGERHCCRVCVDTDLCGECLIKYNDKRLVLDDCKGHAYFEVPLRSPESEHEKEEEEVDVKGMTGEEILTFFAKDLGELSQGFSSTE